MFELEKYHGSKSRYTCPNCGHRNVFARHIDTETKQYLAEAVGRCNRESKCGYHYTPKDYFRDNPQDKYNETNLTKKRKNVYKTPSAKTAIDYIEFDYFKRTLTNYENNAFIQFLLNLFPDMVETAVKTYFIGTTRTGKTIFWQIDRQNRIRTGKIIAYNPATGKRIKTIFPTWAHYEFKKAGHLKNDFRLDQCFFGEHLLRENPDKPLAIVEAEKTAVIASLCFPELIWLAVGAKGYLKAHKLKRLSNRRIILYPDADSYSKWQEVAQDARKLGLTVNVSALIETRATNEQKESGYDLADYLIEEQMRINEHNAFIDNRFLSSV